MRNAGRSFGSQGAANVRAKWGATSGSLIGEAEALVRQISTRSRTLAARGNSVALVSKLNRARRSTNAVTSLSTLAVVLEEIASMDLLWNNEVPAELKSRRRAAEEDRRAKAVLRADAAEYTRRVRALTIYDTAAVSEALRGHPNVAGSLTGAIDRLLQGGPDAERQALLSCRAAIERLAIEKTGIGDPKVAVRTLLPSDTDHKPTVAVINFLGGKVHGGSSPTRADAEYGLKLTMATLEVMARGAAPSTPGSASETSR